MKIHIVILILLFSVNAYGATYYVDFVSGNDNNNGTATGTAFQHCPGDDNATDTADSTTLSAGDTVIFKGGVEYVGEIDIDWSGTEGSPITYDGNSAGTWGTGKAIIDGTAEAFTHGFYASVARNYVTINNFEIRDIQYNAAGAYGILWVNNQNESTGITISNNYVHSIGRWENSYPTGEITDSFGIMLTYVTDYLITGNEVTKTGASGITVLVAKDGIISNNTVHSYVRWGISLATATTSARAATGNVITNNTIYDLYYYDAGWYSGGGDPPHTDFIFVYGGVDTPALWPTGTIVEKNLMYNNYSFSDFGGTAMMFTEYADNTVIRNNLFINTHAYWAISSKNSTNTKVYNNTIYSDRGSGFTTSAYDSDVEIYNNINAGATSLYFIGLNDVEALGAIYASDNNLFFMADATDKIANMVTPYTTYTLAEWQALGYDINSLTVDNNAAIKFVDTTGYPTSCETMDLRLQSDSPAINAGATLVGFSTDYSGTSRPQGSAWDIGAYEYEVNTPSSPSSVAYPSGRG